MKHGSRLAVLAAVLAGATWPGREPARAESGAELYAQHCSVCHGQEGAGDGKIARLLTPRPTDLTRGLFKLRSTPTGKPPTDDDLVRTVSRGIPGTAMPAFSSVLSEAESRRVVEFVESLAVVEDEGGRRASLFALRGPATPLAVPPPPSPAPEVIAAGKRLYTDAGCAVCHGSSGHGDGPSAEGLHDVWGRPIRPTDLARGVFKGGGDPKSLYLRIATGMDGTPMPAFGDDVLSPEQRWALVAYIRSLGSAGAAPEEAAGETVR